MTEKNSEDKINLTESLKELSVIVSWFDEQEDVDVEAGLEKVREAARLIRRSRSRLSEIENEFKEIEKEIEEDVVESEVTIEDGGEEFEGRKDEDDINIKDIPF